MQVEGLEQCGPCGTPVVWYNNARHGGGACLSVQKHIQFVLGALKMLLLNSPDVSSASSLVQERNTTKVSGLYLHQLIERMFSHDGGLLLYSCLPSAVQSQFLLCDLLVH